MKQDFGKSIERLLDGIKSDYAKWSSPQSVDDVSSRMMMEFSKEFLTRKVMSSKPLDGEHQLSGREVLSSIVELIGLDGQDRGTYNEKD